MGILEGLQPPVKQYPCKVRSVLAELDEKDKTILLTAVNNEDLWPAKTLSNSLKQRGISIIDTSITRHRQGLCSCLKA